MRDFMITSSILILAVLGIRFLAKGKISPCLQYALWLIVALRLCFPLPLGNSALSVLNYLPPGEEETAVRPNMPVPAYSGDSLTEQNQYTGVQTPGAVSVPVDGQTAAGTDRSAGMQMTDRKSVPEEKTFPLSVNALRASSVRYLPFLWFAGALVMAAYLLFYMTKWQRYVRENRKKLNLSFQGTILEQDFDPEGKYRGKLGVYTLKGLPSPFLSGRNIYLTKKMTADPREYCHYRHGDSFWVLLRCVLLVIYWFHPLVWIAARVSRQDGELACDAAAIRLLGEKERLSYGRTLLNLIASNDGRWNRNGLVSTMNSGEKGIRERIYRIAKKQKYFMTAAVVVVAAVLGLLVVTFSGKTREGAVYEAREQEAVHTELMQKQTAQIKMLDVAMRDEAEQQKADANQKAGEQKEEQGSDIAQRTVLDALRQMPSSEVKQIADYREAYLQEGPRALSEGLYVIKDWQETGGSRIRIYGMYTEANGCEGIRIELDGKENDFALPWLPSGVYAQREDFCLYEKRDNGRPKTFAFQIQTVNTEDSEIWQLYLCDCDEAGNITLYSPAAGEYMAQMDARLRFQIAQEEGKVHVYDSGKEVGVITVPDQTAAAGKIEAVVTEGTFVQWNLGSSTDELRLLTCAGLKLEDGTIWYEGLNLLSFPVSCGSYGARNVQIGEAFVDQDFVCVMRQQLSDEGMGVMAQEICSLPKEVVYADPCPDAERISDTFGSRVNPATGAVRVHEGVDYAAPEGTDILAAADGVVHETGFDKEKGNYVVLYHSENGDYTHYEHCAGILVKEGAQVRAGSRIATVGSTGRSTGDHLHFAVERDGKFVEPYFGE